MNLGHVLYSRDPSKSRESYREAVAISARQGLPAAEVESRIALARQLATSGEQGAADDELALAAEAAERADDLELKALVHIRQAWQDYYQGRNLDDAYNRLRKIESGLFPDGPRNLQDQCLRAMVVVSYVLGRYEESLAFKERQLARALEDDDLAGEALARFSIAIHQVTAELPSPPARAKARALFEAALESARAAHLPSREVQALFELGKLVGGEDGRDLLDSCVRVAEEQYPKLLNYCLGALAFDLIDDQPTRAQALVERLLDRISASADPWTMAYGWEERLALHWAMLPRPQAIQRSLDVLSTIETLRDFQRSGAGRADLLSVWSGVYYWLAGHLLASEVPSREDLELAFQVLERMRARVLLESLEDARAIAPPAASEPLIAERSELLERQVEIQRRLLDPRLGGRDRQQAIDELETVESEEQELGAQIAREFPSYGPLQVPDFARLDQIEARLGEDEALLSFQIGLEQNFYNRFAGGAWLLVSTRAGSRAYRLPADRVVLEPALGVLLGQERLEDAAAGLARLWEALLEQALADLPVGVERLVIVPDGQLHRLPFALLGPQDGDPLIRRYQLSIVPSATLWLKWKDLSPPPGEAPVLAFADPVLARPDGLSRPSGPESRGEPAFRQWSLAEGARLPPLPYARQEGRAVVRILGGDSRLLEGEQATERFLKERGQDLSYRLLHFATHAVINDEVPERSAVLLAPGAEDEDGWLQPREIVELDLEGRVVVLASCDSARGRVLRGEGAMSLARAFFQAEAPVVVASLWRLPDDQTAALFQEFYRGLADGSSVAAALADAQREMLRRGAPARAWAGLVALGNGDLVPFPGGLEDGFEARILRYGLLGLLALGLILWVVWRRRQSN